jgi:hypothetical protein
LTTWNLNRLRYAVRKITGKFDTTQLPDQSVGEVNISNPAGIDDYINDFYLYDLPEHLRTLKLKDFYIFNTIPNCGTYSLPQYIKNVEPPIYVDNYQFAWYQWPDVFYRIWPELNFIDRNLFTPNGSTPNFTFTLTQTPVQQGTVVIGLQPNIDGTPSPKLETFTDQDQPIPLDIPQSQFFVNPGTLISNQYTGVLPPPSPGITPGTGTIDYLTGAVTIVYITAPPNGTNSSCHYHPYVASRPRDIMFYQQQLFLRPIPNDTYAVKVMSYFMPTVVLNAATNSPSRPLFNVTGANSGDIAAFGTSGTDLPLFNEWWQLIAYGAALKIFIEDGEHEEYARYKAYFEEQKLLAQREALRQLANQRIQTPYAENVSGPAFPIFPIY